MRERERKKRHRRKANFHAMDEKSGEDDKKNNLKKIIFFSRESLKRGRFEIDLIFLPYPTSSNMLKQNDSQRDISLSKNRLETLFHFLIS